MSKIVRLTESDLVRIVKRVINESVTAGPFTVGGKNYKLMVYGNGEIGYDSGQGVAVTDPKIVTQLNKMSGFEMHPSGRLTKRYVELNPAKYPKIYSFLTSK
jgi:hypothetical protein